MRKICNPTFHAIFYIRFKIIANIEFHIYYKTIQFYRLHRNANAEVSERPHLVSLKAWYLSKFDKV